jgi:hypothetical protein
MRILGLWNVSRRAQFAFKQKHSLVFVHCKHTKAFVTTPIYYVNAGNIKNTEVKKYRNPSNINQ